jgi:anti-sigma factor RsiW
VSEHGLPEELISAYLDGEVDPKERAAVDARLAESAEWRAVLDEVRDVRAAVRALPSRDAPAGFWDELVAGDADDENIVPLHTRSRGGRGLRWAGVAAAAAAAAVIGIALVPAETRVQPAVSTFGEAHAVRSSVGDDAISTLAGATVATEVGR